jgi:putative heme-binding domain-containing protein
MPPSNLPEDKLWQLVAFVRALSAPAFESRVPGDVEAGGLLFFGKAGCSECHAILGRGGRLGPDLSNVGMSRQAAYLEEALLNPGARFPEGYRAGAVALRDGSRIEGIIREKTNYLVAVLDQSGEIRRIDMKEVSEVTFRKSSLMPGDYAKRLSKDEIQNVLAFLSRQSLRPERPMERGR